MLWSLLWLQVNLAEQSWRRGPFQFAHASSFLGRNMAPALSNPKSRRSGLRIAVHVATGGAFVEKWDGVYRESSQIQLTSQVLPSSDEKDCSIREDLGEMSSQT